MGRPGGTSEEVQVGLLVAGAFQTGPAGGTVGRGQWPPDSAARGRVGMEEFLEIKYLAMRRNQRHNRPLGQNAS